MGGLTAALLCSWGGMACVPFGVEFAGFAIGLVAVGGFAVGVVSWGGMAIGMYAKGGVARSHYTAQNVPEWMETLSTLIPTFQQFSILNGALVAFMLVLLAVGQISMFKEQRRIEQVLGVRARMN